MIKHKSTLAKLLAKENITVQYGNYKTAWFDIKNRILGIPLWKDMGKDVADLFIGHEVGHALFTPYEGWHDSPEKLEGCPRTYINVIEDARIERHIKDAYVGLVAPMARGYKKLFDDDFFGVDEDLDWDEVKLIDKINLKAKVGAHLEVPMNDEEMVYYNRSMKTETFDEVLDLVRDILAYTKENQQELMTPPPMGSQDKTEGHEENDDMSPTGHDDMESQDEQTKDTGNEQQDPIDETDEEGKDSAKGDTSESNDDGNDQGNVEEQSQPDEDVSITDESFRRKEHTLLDKNEDGTQTLIGNEFSKPVRDAIVTPYADLKKARQIKLDQYNEAVGTYDNMLSIDEHREEFKQYLKTVKQNVNFAVKEFEMRKAAFRYTRAQTAKTGSVDVNRLWSYKTNDDIFARVTKLADAKNHGMMMLIDYSGSMSECMTNVMDQLLHLVVFCKTVNIPFDVYGFTNSNPRLSQWKYDEDREESIDHLISQIESEIHHGGLSLPQVIASTLKKSDYEEALFHIYLRKILAKKEWGFYERYVLAQQEEYGSTPLNQSLVAAHRMVDNFKRNNNIDNMNFVVISDGDTNGISIVKNQKRDYTLTQTYKGAIINIMGEHIKLQDTRKGGTQSLLENLQKKFGCTTIGFFLAENSHNFKYKIEDCDEETYYDSSNMRKYQKEYNKNKCVTFKDTLGYNEFYILKSKRLETDAEEFVAAEDASKGQLTTAFKRFSKSKKLNKTLLTNFGKVVAE